jgi:hypothetical protein
MYVEKLAARAAVIEEMQRSARECDIFYKICREFSVLPCDANFGRFIELAQEHQTELTYAMAVEGMRNHFFVSTLASMSAADQRMKEIDIIIQLLAKARSTFDLNTERKRLGYLTLAEVRARRQEIECKQELSVLSTDEVRQVVRDGKPSYSQQFPTLPPEMTSSVLKRMPAAQLRDAQKQYGNENINARLRGEA